jgi:hypothetical protein
MVASSSSFQISKEICFCDESRITVVVPFAIMQLSTDNEWNLVSACDNRENAEIDLAEKVETNPDNCYMIEENSYHYLYEFYTAQYAGKLLSD